MQKKEILEIKKLFTVENQNLTRIALCYVSSEKERLLLNTQTFMSFPEEEKHKYLNIFQKCLSGAHGKVLFDVRCDVEENQNLLNTVREEKLTNQEHLEELMDQMIESYQTAGNYLIVVAHGIYDVPMITTDHVQQEDASEQVYDYVLCAFCPVLLSDPGLSVNYEKMSIFERIREWVVTPPVNGVLYPAFQERCADLGSALYFAKKAKEKQENFLETVLNGEIPLTGEEEKEWFSKTFNQATGLVSSLDTVKNVQRNVIEHYMESGEVDSIDRADLCNIMELSGFDEEELACLETAYDAEVGRNNQMTLSNIQNLKYMEVEGDGFHIKLDADSTDQLEVIRKDGRLYLGLKLDSNDLVINGLACRLGRLQD